MKFSTLTAMTFLCVSFLPNITFAQSEMTSGKWGYSGHVANLSIGSEEAFVQGVADSAFQLGFYGDYSKNQWLTSLGLNFVSYDDNDSFEQSVIGEGIFNDGDISTESSDASAFVLSVATGYQWYLGDGDVRVALQGGFGQVVSSERSIPNCSDCPSFDIDLDGGLFAKTQINKSFQRFSLGAFAQQYVSGDFGNVFGLQLASSF